MKVDEAALTESPDFGRPSHRREYVQKQIDVAAFHRRKVEKRTTSLTRELDTLRRQAESYEQEIYFFLATAGLTTSATNCVLRAMGRGRRAPEEIARWILARTDEQLLELSNLGSVSLIRVKAWAEWYLETYLPTHPRPLRRDD